MRILFIEDNSYLLSNLYDFFESFGYDLDSARDGKAGLELAITGDYDVIVLDLILPKIDGLTVCERLRKEYCLDIPILMLTARDQVEDRIAGLFHGADDYLVKPFSLAELNARIIALVRRAKKNTVAKALTWQDIEIDPRLPVVRRQGAELMLTPIEHRLLLCLVRAAPEVVPRRQLEREVWGNDPPDSDSLRTHIHALRQRVDRGYSNTLIKTVHGVGYRLSAA